VLHSLETVSQAELLECRFDPRMSS
jgi:hypothetical protein